MSWVVVIIIGHLLRPSALGRRQPGRPLLLEGGNPVLGPERHGDVVQALEEPFSHEWVHIEPITEPLGIVQKLPLQVHGQLTAGTVARPAHQLADALLRQHDGEHAVLDAVVVKDIGEGRGDYRSKPVLAERPHSVLAGGAAAEVSAGDQYLRPLVAWLVQLEPGVRPAVGQVAPVEEGGLPEARPLDPLDELAGDDLVRVYVGTAQGSDDPFDYSERFHGFSYVTLSGSEGSVCSKKCLARSFQAGF